MAVWAVKVLPVPSDSNNLTSWLAPLTDLTKTDAVTTSPTPKFLFLVSTAIPELFAVAISSCHAVLVPAG